MLLGSIDNSTSYILFLAIVSNALVDSLRQYQRMMPENQPQNFEDGNFYHHLSSQAGASPSKLEMPEAYRKLTVGGKRK